MYETLSFLLLRSETFAYNQSLVGFLPSHPLLDSIGSDQYLEIPQIVKSPTILTMSSTGSSPAILLTGATGYVGGTVLHHILNHEPFRDLTLTILVRGEERAKILKDSYGRRVQIVLFNDLSETEFIEQVASNHDIVINAGSGFHPPSAVAMVQGLAKRKAQTGKDVWMVHTSGCSNICDRPITGVAYPDREWDDADSLAIYEFEKAEEAREPYIQRTAELAVLDTAISTGVKAMSIQGTAIYGTGEGLFQRAGLIVPIMVQFVLKNGFAFNVGDGTGVLDKVHVSDFADLYVLILEKILNENGNDLPTGEKGIIFAADNRRLYHRYNAQNALDAAFEAGRLTEKKIKTLPLPEAAKTTAGAEEIAEKGWAGHRLTKSTLAYQWGWSPKKTEEDFLKDYRDEVTAVTEGKRVESIAGCLAQD
jgi:nucleoside-diphosphate-sugar epimerase